MNQKNNIIAIFTSEYKIGALVYLDNGNLIPIIKDDSVSNINVFLDGIKTREVQVKKTHVDEDGIYRIGFKNVAPTSDEYINAVLEELKTEGFQASLISTPVLKILEIITEKLPKEVLEKELGGFLNLSEEDALVFYEDLQRVVDIVG